jgi:predicted SprT family Zn-dependent metalloprotease
VKPATSRCRLCGQEHPRDQLHQDPHREWGASVWLCRRCAEHLEETEQREQEGYAA